MESIIVVALFAGMAVGCAISIRIGIRSRRSTRRTIEILERWEREDEARLNEMERLLKERIRKDRETNNRK